MDNVGSYYDEKTNRIIEKYGQGVRIHYHAGIKQDTSDTEPTTKAISSKMHEYQENVLSMLSRYIPEINGQYEILDVGCGLGGGALYWAMEKNARVTAITIAKNHIDVVNRCALEAGVDHLVTPLLQDAHSIPGKNIFDMIVAIESSCYLDRSRWFKRMYELLRPGGILQICDWFFENEQAKENTEAKSVQSHWKTSIGTVSEYINSAGAVGFKKIIDRNITEKSHEFWNLARKWNEQKKTENELDSSEIHRLDLSSERIQELQHCFLTRIMLQNHLVFQK